MIRNLTIAVALVATLTIAACGSTEPTSTPKRTSEPTKTAPAKTTPTPTPKAKPVTKPNEGAPILREARKVAAGTSYAADLDHVERVERDGEGLKVYTDMYSKPENRADFRAGFPSGYAVPDAWLRARARVRRQRRTSNQERGLSHERARD